MRAKSLLSQGFAIALALTFTLSLPVFGQDVSRSIVLSREAKLGGQSLPQGKYTITFDDSKDGELAIKKGGKEVVKTSYKLMQLTKDAADNAVVFTAAPDGSLQVKRIEIKGSKVALNFE